MASLVVLKFDTTDGAEKGLEPAQSLQKQQLLQILDVATVTWPKGRKRPKTRQVHLGALDHGINDDFIKQVRAKVTEGTSGLFLLLGAVTTDKVVEAFKSAPHFELIASNLTHEQEKKLKEAFAA